MLHDDSGRLASALLRRSRRGRVSVGWLTTLSGLTLTTIAGVLLGSTAGDGDRRMVVVSGIMLALGALVAVVGVGSNTRLVRLGAEMESLPDQADRARPTPDVPPPPAGVGLLGELVVHKYHLISDKDLARALARQRETNRRLGQILVEMGLVKWPDLVRVLEEQLCSGGPRGPNGPPGAPVKQAPDSN